MPSDERFDKAEAADAAEDISTDENSADFSASSCACKSADNKGVQDPERVIEAIERLPAKDRERVRREIFLGPVPPPSILQGYEDVLPGAAERILSMSEEEANHRRRQEEKLVNSNCRDGLLGLWLGFGIGALALIVSGGIAIWGSPWAGGFLGSVSIGALVSSFIYGSRQKRPVDSLPPDDQN